MASRWILSMSQEQQEKSLFVVVGYLVSFRVAWNGGTRYFVPHFPLGSVISVIYLTLGFLKQNFGGHWLDRSSVTSNPLYVPFDR
jgi:hypothetical protein